MSNYSLSHGFILLCSNAKKLSACFLVLTLSVANLVLAQTQMSEKEVAQSLINKTANPSEISLLEQGDTLMLLPDGTCSVNNKDSVSLDEENNPWQSIVNKPYLERLSGLAILEQVKQQMQQSRMVMEIDADAETKLMIKISEHIQEISLYSIDLMHSSYPKAILLEQFMEIVELMRKAKLACDA